MKYTPLFALKDDFDHLPHSPNHTFCRSFDRDLTTLKNKVVSAFEPKPASTTPAPSTIASGFDSAEDARKAREANLDAPIEDKSCTSFYEKGKEGEEQRREREHIGSVVRVGRSGII